MAKIILEATKNAPETVQIGHEEVKQTDGFFTTGNRDFADYLIGQKYGKEVKEAVNPPAKKKVVKTAKPKTTVEKTEPKTTIETSAGENNEGATN